MSVANPKQEAVMTFTLPPLSFDINALEPHMSARTLEFHHGKHHKAYIDKANELAAGTDLASKSLEQATIEAHKKGGALFNNVGQHYNHSFFWNCLKPNGGGTPPEKLAKKIDEAFGSLDKFKEAFLAAATTQFGSGWAWLVQGTDGKLEVAKTANAETPLTDGKTPLLVCDVWEHAYYLDFQNRRPDFVKTFLDKLVNWDFAVKNLK